MRTPRHLFALHSLLTVRVELLGEIAETIVFDFMVAADGFAIFNTANETKGVGK